MITHIRSHATGFVSATVVTLIAFCLFAFTAAPGPTWAHFGADGGELLAAAVTNGVPHPPGYPAYILSIRLWLAISDALFPGMEPARAGNLFSAICAALAAGVTVLATGAALGKRPGRWLWSSLAGLAWIVSPLFWGQALITEVYALHALLFALLGLVALGPLRYGFYLVPIVAIGLAHHATFALLLPAVLYCMTVRSQRYRRWRPTAYLASGVILGLLLHLRTLAAAGASGGPAPVNWGYADNWDGLLWLLTAAAYRSYQFALPAADLLARISAWAYTIAIQYTPVGLVLVLLGLAHIDRHAARLRNFVLLWSIPVSVYAIGYHTWDSLIYLLPVTWMCAILLAIGLDTLVAWLRPRWPFAKISVIKTVAGLTLLGILLLAALRGPALSLRNDAEAEQYISRVAEQLSPESIVVTNGDQETFALWYAAWANHELSESTDQPVLVNASLYQFPWYRRLLTTYYPQIPGIGVSLDDLVRLNRGSHDIFFTEPEDDPLGAQLESAGPLWRYSD